MKLGTKIMLGFALTCGIFVIMSAVIYFQLTEVNKQARDLDEDILPVSELASAIQTMIVEQGMAVKEYAIQGGEHLWQQAVAEGAGIKDPWPSCSASRAPRASSGCPA